MFELIRQHDPNSEALIDASNGVVVTYGELVAKVEQVASHIRQVTQRSLMFLDATNTIDSIVVYLASLHLKYPVCLLDPGLKQTVRGYLADAYQPTLLLSPSTMAAPQGYVHAGRICTTRYDMYVMENDPPDAVQPHPDLALVLTTSGATGNPKLIRLQLSNVIANASSIAEYLQLTPLERSIQSLPMHYSYGLSLINSHIVAGGTTVLTSGC